MPFPSIKNTNNKNDSAQVSQIFNRPNARSTAESARLSVVLPKLQDQPDNEHLVFKIDSNDENTYTVTKTNCTSDNNKVNLYGVKKNADDSYSVTHPMCPPFGGGKRRRSSKKRKGGKRSRKSRKGKRTRKSRK